MTDRQAEAFCWATELAMAQQPVTLSVTEAREVSAAMQRLHADNTTLRTGYDAARLEIESLRAALTTAVPATVLAQLRHLYTNLKNGGVRDTAQAKRLADSLLGPVIVALETAATTPTAQAEGWRLVPVEPTQEMLDAVRGRWSSPSACYRAILAAAPITPTSAEGPNPALKETP